MKITLFVKSKKIMWNEYYKNCLQLIKNENMAGFPNINLRDILILTVSKKDTISYL